jgi:hypothetical protein
MLAEVVVFPTPPFPDVTTMISVKVRSPQDEEGALGAA